MKLNRIKNIKNGELFRVSKFNIEPLSDVTPYLIYQKYNHVLEHECRYVISNDFKFYIMVCDSYYYRKHLIDSLKFRGTNETKS